MSDDLTLLYPSMTPSTPEPAAEPLTLLGEKPNADAPRPSTDDELKETLYDPRGIYGQHIREPIQALADEHGLSGEQVDELYSGGARLFSTLELSTAQADEVAGLVARYATGASDEEANEWRRETTARLRERFGSEANARLAQAQELVQRFPGFAQMLAGTGLGNNWRVVEHLVDRAPHLLAKMRPR